MFPCASRNSLSSMEHNWRLEMSLEKTKQTAFSTNNRNSLAMNYLDVISYHPFSTTGKRSSNFLCINPRCLWSRKPTSSWCTNDLIIVINLARTHREINFVRGNSHRIELCHSQHQRHNRGKLSFFFLHCFCSACAQLKKLKDVKITSTVARILQLKFLTG